MRKMRILALVLALALLIVGCAGCSSKPAATEATTAPTEEPVVDETADAAGDADAQVADAGDEAEPEVTEEPEATEETKVADADAADETAGEEPAVQADEAGADEAVYTRYAAMTLFPTNWNPHAYKTANDGDVYDMLVYPLYGLDYTEDYSGFTYEPYMATADPEDVTANYVGEDWGIEEGATGRAFRITLNPDACWQDGTPINADTYMYSMQQLLDPDMKNYRASDYYQASLRIHNAREYVYAGTTTKVENSTDAATFVADKASWVLGEDGQYTTADGAKLYIGLKTAYAWMGGSDSLETYASYFQEAYDTLLALADADGFVPATDENLATLYSFTGSDDWGNETEDQLAFYTSYDVTYPELTFDKVGFQKVDEYTIDVILDKELIGFYIKYNLSSFPLVYEPYYEACKVQDSTGAWSSTYGTSVETTMSYGPYKLTKCMTDQVLEFDRNETWYGYSDKYADEFGTFERGIDGEICEQYQTDHIVWTLAADISTREQMFLKGQLDNLGLNAALLETYGSSESLYYTQLDSTYYGIINSDYEMLLAAENVLNGGNADDDPAACPTPYMYNKTILTIKEFRQALCYCLDRTALCSALYPAGTAAFSLFSNGILADPLNGKGINDFDAVKAGVCEFWGVTYGEGGEFATLEEAYDAITGYDIDQARELVDVAVDKAIEAGLMTEDSIVRITYCAASASETETKWYNFFSDMFTNLFVGTKLEGKFQYDSDFTLGNEFGDKIKDGACDTAWGFGWNGGELDPYDLFQVYVDGCTGDDAYQYDGWVDWSIVDLTLTLDIGDGNGEQEMTYSVYDWWQIINGVDNFDAGLPDWAFGKMEDGVRAAVLGQLEKTILLNYTSIPLMNEGSVQLKSYKINFGREEYIFGLGRGGDRYMTYNFTDAEWTEYCASQTDGILTY